MSEVRTCTRCFEVKPLTEFYRERRSPTGYRSNCKVCHIAAGRARQATEKYKDYQVRYRTAHREKARATTAQWKQDNPDWDRRLQEEYRADPEHKATARERAKAFRIANPEKRLEYGRRRRARMRKSAVGKVVIRPELLAAKKAYWGNRCWMCGGSEARAWDHVKPINKRGPHILANLRPACLRCNASKSDCWPYSAVLARVGQ